MPNNDDNAFNPSYNPQLQKEVKISSDIAKNDDEDSSSEFEPGTFSHPNKSTREFYKWREEFSKRLAEELKKYSDEDLHNMHIECCFGDPTAYALADMGSNREMENLKK